MRETPDQWLITIARRCGRQLTDRFITQQEFTNRLFDEFADSKHVCPEIIPALWESIPESARIDFIAALRAAILPEFRCHAFEIGGSRGLTDDERRYQAERNTKRVQAWALAFLLFGASGET